MECSTHIQHSPFSQSDDITFIRSRRITLHYSNSYLNCQLKITILRIYMHFEHDTITSQMILLRFVKNLPSCRCKEISEPQKLYFTTSNRLVRNIFYLFIYYKFKGAKARLQYIHRIHSLQIFLYRIALY